MVRNLSVNEIYHFITGDFIACWDSLAGNLDPGIGRGNFMFARQAMNLLEFACRLYEDDSTGQARVDFSNELNSIEPKYFTRLPTICATTKGFTLPHLENRSGDLLLWSLFDLIRHGLAHQYQQIIADLNDGHHFFVQLTGATPGRTLSTVENPRPNDHLGYCSDEDGDVAIRICPEILFIDFDNAINRSNLLGRNLNFDYLSRGGQSNRKFYNFDAAALINNLNGSGHRNIA
jgi:hypothetical protein